jgi:hypothetical protein
MAATTHHLTRERNAGRVVAHINAVCRAATDMFDLAFRSVFFSIHERCFGAPAFSFSVLLARMRLRAKKRDGRLFVARGADPGLQSGAGTLQRTFPQ